MTDFDKEFYILY